MFLSLGLKSYIEAMNAEAQAWMNAAPGRWRSQFHTDMEDWAQSGIHTVEDFLQMLDGEHEKNMRKSSYDDYDDYYYPEFDLYEDEYTTDADREYYDYMDMMSLYEAEDDAYYEQLEAQRQNETEFFPPMRHHIPSKYLDGGDW